jgi:2-dehydro-3-deoxyphosphooctonate aldolase (KDO 8-P synthase)
VSAPNSVITLSGNGIQTPVVIGGGARIVFIAGPCQLESRQHALEMAHALKEIGQRLNVGIIYKTSFDKANRTSATAARGIGLEGALPIFAEIREVTGLPVLTDVHNEEQCGIAAQAVDVLQIPAFLSRQTDLLLAAAATGKAINIKKGQFLAPWDMKNVIAKVVGAGNPNVMACERGASFGYNTLVSDMRALPVLRDIGCPRGVRRDPQCPAAGRAGDLLRWSARVRAGPGPRRRGRRRRCGVHGNPPGSRSRPVGRSQHGPLVGVRGPGRRPDRL